MACQIKSSQIFYLPEGQKATNNGSKTLNELTKKDNELWETEKMINKKINKIIK